MNNQEQSNIQSRCGIPTETPPLYVKPRPGIGGTQANHLGIYLPNGYAQIESGKPDQWNLSIFTTSVAIEGFTLYEGASSAMQFNETNLNCLTFTSPRRIEIITADDIDAAPYLVFQEVVNGNAVTGWQIYAPTPFEVVDTALPPNSWQTAVSSEPVSIKQVRLYDGCNFNIENPPPVSEALFQKITTQSLSEVDLWT